MSTCWLIDPSTGQNQSRRSSRKKINDGTWPNFAQQSEKQTLLYNFVFHDEIFISTPLICWFTNLLNTVCSFQFRGIFVGWLLVSEFGYDSILNRLLSISPLDIWLRGSDVLNKYTIWCIQRGPEGYPIVSPGLD